MAGSSVRTEYTAHIRQRERRHHDLNIRTVLAEHERECPQLWRHPRKRPSNDTTLIIQQERERRGALSGLNLLAPIDEDEL